MKLNDDIYQYVVLLAVVGLNTWVLATTGQLNETLTGALIGVMIGLPVKK